MQAFEISGDDAVLWERIRETASGAAFECALELFACEAPARKYGSGLPAARDDGVERGWKSTRFIGWHLAGPPLGRNDTRIGGFICTGAIGRPCRMSNRRCANSHRRERLCHLGVRRASHVNDFVPGDFL